MADNYTVLSGGDEGSANSADYTPPTFEDYGRSALTGITGLASNVAGTAASLSKDPTVKARWQAQQDYQDENTDSLLSGLTPSAQAGMRASITSGEFWQHPLRDALLQSAPAAAPIVASILPGGIVADALSAAGASAVAAGAVGTGVSMGTQGALSMSQVIGDVSSAIRRSKDSDLRDPDGPNYSKVYSTWRASGMSTSDAKSALTDYALNDGSVVLAGLAGAVGGAGGLGGQIARGTTGAAGRLARAGVGALEGSAGMGIMSGGVDAAEQMALERGGQQKEFDPQEWAHNVLVQMGIGGGLAGIHGALSRGGEASPTRSERAYPKPEDGAPTTDTADKPQAIPVESTSSVATKDIPAKDIGPISDPAIAAALASKLGGKQSPTPESKPTPPETAPVADTAPPTKIIPESNLTPATDTAVPEAPNTLQAQHQELVAGTRPVMVFKGGVGAGDIPLPKTLRQTKIGNDVYRYDPKQIEYNAIRSAVAKNTIGGLLGLGPVTKDEAVARAKTGETPVAITERAPDGTELKAAAGTDQTAPVQVQALTANKAPDSTVQVEPDQKIIAERLAQQTPSDDLVQTHPAVNVAPAQLLSPTDLKASRAIPQTTPESKTAPNAPRVLEDISAKGKADREDDVNAAKAIVANNIKASEPAKEPAGKNWTKAEKAKRAADNVAADKIMDDFKPDPKEALAINPTLPGGVGARSMVLARAKAMLAAAKERGIKVAGTLKDFKDKAQEYGTGHVLLAEARDLVKNDNPKTHDFERFIKREYDLRAGFRDDVLAERRAEGDARKKQSSWDEIEKAGVPQWGASAKADNFDAVEHTGYVPEGKEGELTGQADVSADNLHEAHTAEPTEGEPTVNLGEEATIGGDTPESNVSIETARERPAPKIGGEAFVAGKAKAPVVVAKGKGREAIKARIAAARAETKTNPTDAEKLAGNYPKGHVTVEGLPVSIETPKGEMRSGTIIPESKPKTQKRILERSNELEKFAGEPGSHEPGDILWGPRNQPVPRDKVLAAIKAAIADGIEPEPLQISNYLGIRQIDAKFILENLKLWKPKPTGKKWAHIMPGDYGYVRGTRGADGDHVDVLIGPHGETGTAYVVNQIDPKTGKFDEHKVILGVKSEAQAAALYDKSFSDGSGPARRASVVAMPREPLKEWLADHSATQEPISEVPNQVKTGSGKSFSPIETTNVKDLIGALQPTAKGSASSKLIPFLARKLVSLAGDVPVHWVDNDTIMGLFGKVPEHLKGQMLQGYYDPVAGHIVLNAEMPVGEHAHIAMHEAVHAALSIALEKDPISVKHLEMLANEFLKQRPGMAREYAFDNEHEFLAEILSNQRLQDIANKLQISPELAQALGIREFRAASLWSGVVALARRVLGWPNDASNVLEGVMSVAEKLSWQQNPKAALDFGARLDRARTMSPDKFAAFGRNAARAKTDDLTLVSKAIHAILEKAPEKETVLEKGVKLLNNDHLRQMMEKHFGATDETNPMRKLTDAIEEMGVRMAHYLKPGDALSKDMYLARRQFEGDRGWNSFVNVVHKSSEYNLHADQPLDSKANAHLRLAKGVTDESEGNRRSMKARAEHPKLSSEYSKLPQPLKEIYGRLRDHYANEHEQRSKAVLKQLLEGFDAPAGSTITDVVKRAMDGTLTEPDAEHYDKLGISKQIKNATEFQKQQGFYAPKKRFGDYVVKGEHEVATPANAKRIDPDTFEFNTRKEAHEFLTKNDLSPKLNIVHYDPVTGLRSTEKDALSTAGSAIKKFQVTLERNHVEFADTFRDAKNTRQAMIDAGIKNVTDVQRRSLNKEIDYSLSSPQIKALIDGVRRRKDLSAAQRAVLEKALTESSITMKAGNRLEPHYLKRRNVQGASDDIVRTLISYSRASAAYRARADFSDTVDGSLKAMHEWSDARKSDGNTFSRQTAIQEMEQRLFGFGSPEYSGRMAPFWQKVMALSFWKRMMSPAHLLLHMTHPGMISGPVLGARHGFGQAYRELYRAYRDMGGVTPALGRGAKGLVDVFKNDAAPTDFLDFFKNKLSGVKDSAGILAMIHNLETTGHIHPNAGFEVGHFGENATRLQSGMERVDRAFRELTSSTESINRVAEAVAAYRLEIRKNGGDHDKAVRYAKDTLANTQGLYSATNAAPIFRNQTLRPFLQFKQFPQMIYHLLGRSLYQAFKGDTPEIRREAVRSFAGVVATHAAMAGAVGLPLELIKAPVMLANALGVTNTTWGDLEDKAQKEASSLLGPQLGEILMHGLSRALGPFSIDATHRLGLGSLLTTFEPQSYKPEDTLNYGLDMLAGAPGSMFTDTLGGMQSAFAGDWEGAYEKLSPIKAIADIPKAVRLGVYGKPTSSGKPGLAPVSPAETLMQALGFKPANVAQYDAAKWASEKTAANVAKEKAALIQKWTEAMKGTGAARATAMQAISAWNTQNPTQRITPSAMHSATKQSASELGQHVTNRNKPTLDTYQQIYNVH